MNVVKLSFSDEERVGEEGVKKKQRERERERERETFEQREKATWHLLSVHFYLIFMPK